MIANPYIPLEAALGMRPGDAIPMRSATDMNHYNDALWQQSRASALAQQRMANYSQFVGHAAQLAGMQTFASAALAVSNAEHKARVKSDIKWCAKQRQLRRKFMAKTRDGYRARRRVELAFWYVGALIVGGGVALPIAMKLYTLFWTWALT